MLPAPGSADPASSDFVLAPLDRLRIDVLGIEDLSRVVQVDGGGNISFPYAGVMQAAGRTPEAIAQQIAQAMRANYIRNPQVTVNVDQAAPRTFTVYGEVREPGNYPAVGSTTLMRAVASARGLGEFARDQEVILFRRVNGHDYAALYNLRAISSGAYADPQVYPDDVIAVGDSQARRRFKDILNITPLLLNPLVLLVR
ncbi:MULTISPECIES: polysaccharide biosynthesis/export family protein [Sphingomonas]|uniref:polysaccharide biosynthesis/export family protein n=1 Tax=Sphingomonas TaxID=13687 RepID=UPI0015EBE66F|nr:polysaccharide biosynthesis/export family protein [Sphingomonas sp. CGMCC 1.13658]MBA2919781.1 polysaccharide export protein [Sphingomonas sp. CGMCC 1.13658]